MLRGIIYVIIIGAIAGWIASRTVTGKAFGIGQNIAVGMVGAILGRVLLHSIGLGQGFIAAIFQATIGAVVLLLLLSVAKRL